MKKYFVIIVLLSNVCSFAQIKTDSIQPILQPIKMNSNLNTTYSFLSFNQLNFYTKNDFSIYEIEADEIIQIAKELLFDRDKMSEATKSLLFDVTHLDERVRLSGRDRCPYNPLKLRKTMFFENCKVFYTLFCQSA